MEIVFAVVLGVAFLCLYATCWRLIDDVVDLEIQAEYLEERLVIIEKYLAEETVIKTSGLTLLTRDAGSSRNA